MMGIDMDTKSQILEPLHALELVGGRCICGRRWQRTVGIRNAL